MEKVRRVMMKTGDKGNSGLKGLRRVRTHRLKPLVFAWVFVFCVLLGAHLVGDFILGNTWSVVLQEKPALQDNSFSDSLAMGVLPGLFGGLQHLAADLLWIRMHQHWAAREVEATRALIFAVSTMDPGNFYFWRQGARMMAYDFPHWRIGSMKPQLSGREMLGIREEEARRAIELLQRAALVHPEQPQVWIEIAQIHLYVRGDWEAAAAHFSRASKMEGAPYFAGRLHAELLRRMGRSHEAYDTYRSLHPTLPPDDPSAAAGVVLQRIRELEDALGIAPQLRYSP